MRIELRPADPFVERSGVRPVEVGAARAVVEQPAHESLNNHVGIRHASALYAAVYEASRVLVLAALGDGPDGRELTLAHSVIDYEHMPLGVITTTAEPDGGAWSSLAADAAANERVALGVLAISADDRGRTVATMRAEWIVSPAGECSSLPS